MVYFYLLGAFLLGSLPSAYILTRLFIGRDIRGIGSGYAGGMNVMRNIHWLPGVLTIMLDSFKGFLAIKMTLHGSLDGLTWLPWAAAFLTVSGHNWSFLLRGKGGKGIAVSFGCLLAFGIWPPIVLAAAMAFAIWLLKDTNTGSAAGMIVLPFISWFNSYNIWGVFLAIFWIIAVWFSHSPDIIAYRGGKRSFF